MKLFPVLKVHREIAVVLMYRACHILVHLSLSYFICDKQKFRRSQDNISSVAQDAKANLVVALKIYPIDRCSYNKHVK